MQGQSFAALGTAQHLAGHSNVLRFSPTVMPGRFALDKVRGIAELKAFGYSEAREALREITPRFLSSPAEPFMPLYSWGSNTQPGPFLTHRRRIGPS
jgi:uncharacterized protein